MAIKKKHPTNPRISKNEKKRPMFHVELQGTPFNNARMFSPSCYPAEIITTLVKYTGINYSNP